MNTLTFTNGELINYLEFLSHLKLSGRASRGRSKLVSLLDSKQQEYSKDFNDVRNKYIILNENSEPAVENNKVKFKSDNDRKKAQEEIDELSSEKAVIDVTEYVQKMQALYTALDDYSYELEGLNAVLYDRLLDKLEKVLEEE